MIGAILSSFVIGVYYMAEKYSIHEVEPYQWLLSVVAAILFISATIYSIENYK